jgi:pyruvate/2-oxoglutarate dehydrogenase complex dihydrolipoamide acyltransferase (E2) component
VPVTLDKSTPNSRANLRIEGEVNIDKMESYRQAQKAQGIKLTPLVFIMKAVIQALQSHPRFNHLLHIAFKVGV